MQIFWQFFSFCPKKCRKWISFLEFEFFSWVFIFWSFGTLEFFRVRTKKACLPEGAQKYASSQILLLCTYKTYLPLKVFNNPLFTDVVWQVADPQVPRLTHHLAVRKAARASWPLRPPTPPAAALLVRSASAAPLNSLHSYWLYQDSLSLLD